MNFAEINDQASGHKLDPLKLMTWLLDFPPILLLTKEGSQEAKRQEKIHLRKIDQEAQENEKRSLIDQIHIFIS